MKHIFTCIAFLCLIIPKVVSAQTIAVDSSYWHSIPFCKSITDTVDKPIHMDYVQIDQDIVKDQLNDIPANGSSIAALLKFLPHFIDGNCNCRSFSQDLGYGLKSTRYTIHGGYGSYNVDAVYFDDHVLKLKLTIDAEREIIEEYLLNLIRLPFV